MKVIISSIMLFSVNHQDQWCPKLFLGGPELKLNGGPWAAYCLVKMQNGILKMGLLQAFTYYAQIIKNNSGPTLASKSTLFFFKGDILR